MSSVLPESFQTNSLAECRNVDEEVTQQSPQHSLFAFTISGVLTSSLSLIGIFGILKSVRFLRNSRVFNGGQFLKETLTALAVWDTILLFSVGGYYSVGKIWEFFFGRVPNAFLYSTLICHPLSAASFTASALLVSALTIQRMFVVRRPLRPRRLSIRKLSNVFIPKSANLEKAPTPPPA